MVVTKEGIELVAKEVLRWPERRKWNARDKDMRFKACFGASTEIVADIWNRIVARGPIEESGGEPKHLLWALVHLKVYSTVETHCALVGWPSGKTFSKWSWYFVKRIAELKDDLISLDNRFGGLDGEAHTNCFMSVDGTDCPIYEPWPFNPKMYSEKFNGPAVKYELGVCLKTGWIVWVNGPFRGGLGDKTIFKDGLATLLFEEEGVEVDKGYTGDDRFKTPGIGLTSQKRKMKSNARSQHEAVNGRLKQFNVLSTHFRHMKPNKEVMMQKHKLCFHAVVVITQLKFQSGATVFADQLDYDVHYF